MILSGMGELHLDIVCDRIHRDFNVSVTLGAIQVSYREAPSRSATRSGLYFVVIVITLCRVFSGRVLYNRIY